MSGFWRRLVATTWARSLEFLRDRSAVGWNLIFPLLLVAGLAYVFSGPGQPQFRVAVLAPADAVLDGRLHPFLDTHQIQFYRESDPDIAVAKVQSQRIDMLLDLRNAQEGTAGRYYVNDQSPKGYLTERLLRGAGGPALERASASGVAVRYVDWVVPGILGMNMMFSCLYGLGYVIVRYRKNGYLKRLNATPLRAFEFILAQLISRLALVVVVTAVVYAGCNLFLHFRMIGSYANLMLVTVFGSFSMIALGLVIAARFTSEELAGGLLNLLSWPMMVISGVFFSLEGAPAPIRLLAQLLPLTHMVDAARAVMLDGAGLAQIGGNLAALALMSALYLALGAILFRWRQD
jgi:ABC-type multidrug transport system permease subunit